ncbi:acyl-CoA dehydrogenase family protein [Gordonia rhizosphera]|uniref:Acyl-CoA dehydrogenase n=1 Tax=Gordonia rhizosphera NBRC 16068 TaxID=1108045 RepID=K6X0Q7_9ACTN|nr:acyl-CoA dehydrogenase family protein [Gordonia rhizosphera]GAB92369.1 acyl-CoA dehydrogenase [Gordonia rhizosphera NBRC 16068]
MSTEDPLLSGDHAGVVSAIDKLCASVVDDEYLARIDRDAVFPAEVMKVLCENGWASMVVPEEYGGSGASASDLTVVLEALARRSLTVSQSFFSMWLLGAAAIAARGTEQQKEKWLSRVARDGALIAFALTEPASGSDAAAVSTSGTRTEGGWIVNGQKVFITGAAIADVIITAIRTGRGGTKRDGITTVLLDPRAPGVEIRPLSKMGLKGIDLCEVFLDGVFVPDDDVLGTAGEGWNGVVDGLALERVCLAAISTGALTDVLDRCLDYATVRKTFGKSLASHQMIAEKIVEMRTAVDAGRGLYKRAAELVDRSHPEAATAGSVAKLYSTRAYVDATREGVQIFGGYGFTDEYPISRHYRDCKYLEIGGGANEIQKIIIARGMGLRV